MGETRLRRKTGPRVDKPACAVSRVVVARGQVIVIQDSDARREVEIITKGGRERVSEMEDTEVLTDVDVTTRDVIGKEGVI